MSDDDMCPNCITPWKCNGPHIHADDTCPTCGQPKPKPKPTARPPHPNTQIGRR